MKNLSNGKLQKNITINVAQEFTPFPAGRKRKEGKFSGEKFREEHLVKALEHRGIVTVELDGAAGYGPSFLDEAFGGLVRNNKFKKKYLEEHLKISTSRQSRKMLIWEAIRTA